MNTLETILDLIDKKKITDHQFLLDLKLNKSSLSDWKKGTTNSYIKHISKIADYFGVKVDYLLGREERSTPNNTVQLGGLIRMPVIGCISAGYNGIANEEILDEYDVPKRALKGYPIEECFVLQVRGDSMYPDFHNNDLIVVHRQSSVDSGDLAVILYNSDEATLKKVVYKKGENWLDLIPRNPEYKTKRIENSDLELCQVLGKVLTLVYREI